MHGSPVLKVISLASWFITGLVSLHIGLVALGWNLFSAMPFMEGKAFFVLCCIAGAAGLWSLIALVMMLMGMGCCKCGCNSHCDKKPNGYGM